MRTYGVRAQGTQIEVRHCHVLRMKVRPSVFHPAYQYFLLEECQQEKAISVAGSTGQNHYCKLQHTMQIKASIITVLMLCQSGVEQY
jgi:hypothetical protein